MYNNKKTQIIYALNNGIELYDFRVKQIIYDSLKKKKRMLFVLIIDEHQHRFSENENNFTKEVVLDFISSIYLMLSN